MYVFHHYDPNKLVDSTLKIVFSVCTKTIKIKYNINKLQLNRYITRVFYLHNPYATIYISSHNLNQSFLKVPSISNKHSVYKLNKGVIQSIPR